MTYPQALPVLSPPLATRARGRLFLAWCVLMLFLFLPPHKCIFLDLLMQKSVAFFFFPCLLVM